MEGWLPLQENVTQQDCDDASVHVVEVRVVPASIVAVVLSIVRLTSVTAKLNARCACAGIPLKKLVSGIVLSDTGPCA